MPVFVIGSGVGDNYATLLLTLPDVAWFKSAVMGALYELSVPDNWIELGDVAASFAVEESSQMLAGYRFMNFNPFPVGLILPFGSDAPPDAFLLCDGTAYDTTDYPELFNAIGYAFGGAGTTFNVPDLVNRSIVGMGGAFDFAVSGGEIDHTLDTSEIPSHTHTIPLTATTLAVEPGEVTVLTPVPFFTQDTGATGGDGSHNNMPPYLSLTYVIYAGRV